MTNGECIYRKTVDYMSRMALEKDDFRRFSVIWEFRVTGNWVAARNCRYLLAQNHAISKYLVVVHSPRSKFRLSSLNQYAICTSIPSNTLLNLMTDKLPFFFSFD